MKTSRILAWARRHARNLVLLGVLGLTIFLMGLLNDEFWKAENLLNYTRFFTETGLIACGMTLIIMTGGIDLSVGSMVGLCGIVLGYAWLAWGAPAALACCLGVGLLAGAGNGLLVTGLRLPALVVTLASMALYRGVAMVISRAQPVSSFPEWFYTLGQGYLEVPVVNLPIPVQLFIWLPIMGAGVLVVSKSVSGRYLRAVGDNERAARFAALPVRRVKFWAYTATGLLCALAAVIVTSRFSTARADAGENYELEVITAVVLGGTSISGGRGTAAGTFLAVLILGLVRNGLTLAGVSDRWKILLVGVILIGTAVLNQRLASSRQT